jgi:hypothetical protein
METTVLTMFLTTIKKLFENFKWLVDASRQLPIPAGNPSSNPGII